MSELNSRYGGTLVDPMVHCDEQKDLVAYANYLPSLQISERSLCDSPPHFRGHSKSSTAGFVF